MKFTPNLKRVGYTQRFYSSSTSSYKVVIVGGGTAGISVAAKLAKRLGKGEIAIVEPSKVHNYQPLWTLVGAGIKTLSDSQRPTAEVLPNNTCWIQNKVASLEPDSNQVVLTDGVKIRYEYLVVASGVELHFDKIKGLTQALETANVSTNYDPRFVEKTFQGLNSVKGGNVLFTQPSTPIKCAGAPQKAAYLAADIFQKNQVKHQVQMKFLSGLPKLFAIEKYAQQLHQVALAKQIQVQLNHDLVEINSKDKIAIFQTQQKPKLELEYSFLHVTPPMGPLEFVKGSKLVDSNGYVEVDKFTLRSQRYANVFGLGDCSNLPTSKTAAAITAQSQVLVENLLHQIQTNLPANQESHYDGYTSCPLFVGGNQLILAEFSGYTNLPLETFPFNQAKPSKLAYTLTKEFIPQIYWSALLKGNWNGPKFFRRMFNPTEN